MLARSDGPGDDTRLLSYALFVGGLCCLAITTAQNYYQGQAMAVTEPGRWLSSLSSVVVELLGLVIMGLFVGNRIARRKWRAAVFFFVLVVASCGWSLTASVSFQGSERLSASLTRQKAIDRAAEIDRFAEDHAKWLRGESVNAAGRRERRDLLNSASKEISQLRNAPPVTFMIPDAAAKVLSDLTGWDVGQVQVGLVSYLSMLLIVLSAVAFPASSYLRYELSEQRDIPPKKKGGQGSPPTGGGAKREIPVTPPTSSVPQVAAKVLQLEIPPRDGGRFTKKAAHRDLKTIVDRGEEVPSQVALQRRWGVPRSTVSRWVNKWEKRQEISRIRNGNRMTVRRFGEARHYTRFA